MVSKVSTKVYLNANRVKGRLFPIYIRIIYKRQKAEISTGLRIPEKEWDDSLQRAKNNAAYNTTINDLINRVYSAINFLVKEKRAINAKILKDLVKNDETDSYSIIEYFQKHIDQVKRANEIKVDSRRRYEDTHAHLVEFLAEFKPNHKDLPIDLIDHNFLTEFDLFLRSKSLQRNTINKHHSRFRTILIKARNEGLITKYPYSNFKLKNTPTDRQYLTSGELLKIEKTNLSHNESLDRVRDIFLFSTYTGLRFSDAQSLSPNNLIQESKTDWQISIIQQKTGDRIQIPLLKPALRIIKKYDNKERAITGKILPSISNQKTNTYLKVIGDLSGIEKPLTHHVARHTYATTILLSNNISIEVVSRLLGHTNIKTTQIYAKVTNKYVTESINKIKQKIK